MLLIWLQQVFARGTDAHSRAWHVIAVRLPSASCFVIIIERNHDVNAAHPHIVLQMLCVGFGLLPISHWSILFYRRPRPTWQLTTTFLIWSDYWVTLLGKKLKRLLQPVMQRPRLLFGFHGLLNFIICVLSQTLSLSFNYAICIMMMFMRMIRLRILCLNIMLSC